MTEPVKRYYIMESAVVPMLDNQMTYTPLVNYKTDVHVVPLVMAADYARLEQECERLLADKAAIDLLNQYIVTAEHPVTGKTAICADSGTLRDCMEAALSAKP